MPGGEELELVMNPEFVVREAHANSDEEEESSDTMVMLRVNLRLTYLCFVAMLRGLCLGTGTGALLPNCPTFHLVI